jgi:hypothetical protein
MQVIVRSCSNQRFANGSNRIPKDTKAAGQGTVSTHFQNSHSILSVDVIFILNRLSSVLFI